MKNFVMGIKSMYIDIFDFFGFWLLDEAAHIMAILTFIALIAACIFILKEKLPWFQEYKKETADDVMEKLRKEDERKKEAYDIEIIDLINEGPVSFINFIIFKKNITGVGRQ